MATGGITPYSVIVYLIDGNGDEVTTWTGITVNSGTAVPHTFSDLQDDQYSVYFIVTDSATPTATTSQSSDKSATVDSVSPPLTAVTNALTVTSTVDDTGPPDGEINVSLNTDTMATGGSESYSSVSVYLKDYNGNIIETWAIESIGGTQTYNFATGIYAGSYDLYFTVTDSANDTATSGNVPAEVLGGPLTANSSSLQITDSTNSDGTDNGTISITIDTDLLATGGVTPYISAKVYCSNGTSTAEWTFTADTGVDSYIFDELPPGEYTLYFDVLDTGNNTDDSDTQSRTINGPLEVDNGALTVTSVTDTGSVLGSNDGAITINLATTYATNGTTPYAALVYCQTSAEQNVNGSPWQYTGSGNFTFPGLLEGTYTLYFVVTDSSDPQQSVESTSFEQVVEATAPG